MTSQEQPAINPIPPQYLDILDPQYIALYNEHHARRYRSDQVSISELRANPDKYTSGLGFMPDLDVGNIKYYDIPVHDPEGVIKVAVYTPTSVAIQRSQMENEHGLPAHVNFHGGGWTTGGLHTDEMWCRHVCQAVGTITIDVDYRLAPEYAFPTQITDAWEALRWVFNNTARLQIDRSRVSIGGMASGAQLAAVMTIKARDSLDMPPLKHQLLTVPIFDVRYVPVEGDFARDMPYESYRLYQDIPSCPVSRMQWFLKHWLGTNAGLRVKLASQWDASPILASSHSNLAPATIFCAEIDILCSEAIAYHQKLINDGTESTLKMYNGVCHPFALWLGKLDKASDYIRDVESVLRRTYAVAAGT